MEEKKYTIDDLMEELLKAYVPGRQVVARTPGMRNVQRRLVRAIRGRSARRPPGVKMHTPSQQPSAPPPSNTLRRSEEDNYVELAKKEIIEAILNRYEIDILQKNEVAAYEYDNGLIHLDFGEEVPEDVKQAAIRWAKKRKLNIVEASLRKSISSRSSIVFASTTQYSTPSRIIHKNSVLL